MKEVIVRPKRKVYERLLKENPNMKEEHVGWGYLASIQNSFPRDVIVTIKNAHGRN